MIFWRGANPLAAIFAGRVAFWVLLETRGRKSGLMRTTPLAAGPVEDGVMWLIAVHGERSSWVRNIRADPVVRIRHRRRLHQARATVEPMDGARLATFGWYPRLGAQLAGIDPKLVRLELGSQTD